MNEMKNILPANRMDYELIKPYLMWGLIDTILAYV